VISHTYLHPLIPSVWLLFAHYFCESLILPIFPSYTWTLFWIITNPFLNFVDLAYQFILPVICCPTRLGLYQRTHQTIRIRAVVGYNSNSKAKGSLAKERNLWNIIKNASPVELSLKPFCLIRPFVIEYILQSRRKDYVLNSIAYEIPVSLESEWLCVLT